MGDDELADFLAAYAKVGAEAGIDPSAADALAVLAEAMLAAGVVLHCGTRARQPPLLSQDDPQGRLASKPLFPDQLRAC